MVIPCAPFVLPHLSNKPPTSAKAHKFNQTQVHWTKNKRNNDLPWQSSRILALDSPIRNTQIIIQEALHLLILEDIVHDTMPFTPTRLGPPPMPPINFSHYAMPTVHPVTGKTILSYKKLMNNPATSKTWQTAFREDFEEMHQGDIKTGQKGTNEMFVIMSKEVQNMHANQPATYANVVVDYRPQKEEPNQI
jgi:hypothetical protein